jgi:N-acyl-D-amino-acid deacylase
MARSLFNPEEGHPFAPLRRCAAAVGLIDRGALRPGFAADITIFDPASIADRANEPRHYPAGITHVSVTGVAVFAGGVHIGAPPARGLRRAATGIA